jgi:hypothetical protein
MARGDSKGKAQVADQTAQDVAPAAVRRVDTQQEAAPASIRTRLEAVIEAERRNLAKAYSVLGCLAVALNEYSKDDGDSPDYAEVAEHVRDPVNGSLERLDSVNLARAMAD